MAIEPLSPGSTWNASPFLKRPEMDGLDLESSVPDWLIDHPQLFALFRELGIDYSCGGKSLRTACGEKGLNPDEVLSRIMNRNAD
ncbi:MAG TPA: DUF542 domain-containing protein [Planctomycetaceae bacterium]|jgi:regulator of cell morphogenesis and NO signaling|nr:DUF542 domain-containing protein [Planctomycetaceae bacterium]